MAKKTYKEKNGTTRVGKFLRGIAGVAPDLLNIVGTVTGVDALNKLGDVIRKSDSITLENKELALKELDLDISEAEQISNRWVADMTSDSWLSKNVRPLTLIFLTLSLAVYIVLDSSIDGFTVKSEWVSLLSSLLLLVYGAYFGMRGLEKIQKIRSN